MELDDETVRVLSCDLSIRPSTAAGIADLVRYVRMVQADHEKVVVDMELSGQEVVESFVDAERLCCSGLQWTLVLANDLITLTIAGTGEQIEVIKRWFEAG